MMKHFAKKFLSVFLAVLMLSSILCTSVAASTQSSAYLSAYRAGITPKSGGKLVITVQVTGAGYMPEIGVNEVHLYESTDGIDFTRIKIFRSSNYPIMNGSGTMFYEDVVTYQGKIGRYYYATAFVYAGNDTGSDARTCDTTIEQAQAYVPDPYNLTF